MRAPRNHSQLAHPLWFVVISLRCLGITVDELCQLAGKAAGDTLLFGGCEIGQQAPLRVSGRYRTTALVAATGSRTTRDGSRLDHLDVRVEIRGDDDAIAGTVTSTYLFKRGNTE